MIQTNSLILLNVEDRKLGKYEGMAGGTVLEFVVLYNGFLVNENNMN